MTALPSIILFNDNTTSYQDQTESEAINSHEDLSEFAFRILLISSNCQSKRYSISNFHYKSLMELVESYRNADGQQVWNSIEYIHGTKEENLYNSLKQIAPNKGNELKVENNHNSY